MTTITQRKKGWWKIWVIIAIIVVALAIVMVLSNLTNADGNPYIDLAPVEEKYLGIYMWASMNSINASLVLVGSIVLGISLTWLYYNYLAGQKVTMNNTINPGYNPLPTTPSQPQTQTDTVIS
jgi:ABC-type Fe3+ transport system permease subunit